MLIDGHYHGERDGRVDYISSGDVFMTRDSAENLGEDYITLFNQADSLLMETITTSQ